VVVIYSTVLSRSRLTFPDHIPQNHGGQGVSRPQVFQWESKNAVSSNFFNEQINLIYFTLEFISVKSDKSKLSVYDMRIFALYSLHNSLVGGADRAVHIAPRLRSILRACHFAAFREGSFGARMEEEREKIR